MSQYKYLATSSLFLTTSLVSFAFFSFDFDFITLNLRFHISLSSNRIGLFELDEIKNQAILFVLYCFTFFSLTVIYSAQTRFFNLFRTRLSVLVLLVDTSANSTTKCCPLNVSKLELSSRSHKLLRTFSSPNNVDNKVINVPFQLPHFQKRIIAGIL